MEVDTKYLQEFVDDTVPLLSQSGADERKYLCELVLGITQKKPYGLSNYLKFFVDEIPTAQNESVWRAEQLDPTEPLPKGTFFRLRSSKFSSLVTMFFSADGTMREDVVAEFTGNKSLPITIYKWNMKCAINYLGSLCECINPTWKGIRIQDAYQQQGCTKTAVECLQDEQICNDIERICGEVFSNNNFQLDHNTYLTQSWFQLVFNYPGNTANHNVFEANVLNNPNRKHNYGYWYCTLLKLSRNYLSHKSAVEKATQDFIAVMPNWTHELLVQLMKSIQGVGFLRAYI